MFRPGILGNVKNLTISWWGPPYSYSEKEAVVLSKLSVQIAEAMPSLESVRHIVISTDPYFDSDGLSKESIFFVDRSAGKLSVSSKLNQ